MSRTTDPRAAERGLTLVEILIALAISIALGVVGFRMLAHTSTTLESVDAKQDAITDMKELAQQIKKTYQVRLADAGVAPNGIAIIRPDRNDGTQKETHGWSLQCEPWGAKSTYKLKSGVTLGGLAFPTVMPGDPAGCSCPAGLRPVVHHTIDSPTAGHSDQTYPALGAMSGLSKRTVAMSFCARPVGKGIALSLRAYYIDAAGKIGRTVEQYNFSPSSATKTNGIQVAPVTPGTNLCPPGVTTGC